MKIELISLQGLLCCLAYFAAGVIDSITGGGGLLTIPVMLSTGIPVHFITGTNQCASWFGTVVSAIKYAKSNKVHFPSALATLPFALAGSFLGAKLNLMVPEKYLKTFMLISVPLIAIFVFVNKDLGDEDHAEEKDIRSVLFWSALIGLFIGGYQGFYGPGAGTFFMLAYAASLKLSLVRSTGNTRFVVAIASISSCLTSAASGALIWNLALAAAIFSIVGSYLGSCLAIKNGAKLIRPLMFCVVALLMIKVIVDL